MSSDDWQLADLASLYLSEGLLRVQQIARIRHDALGAPGSALDPVDLAPAALDEVVITGHRLPEMLVGHQLVLHAESTVSISTSGPILCRAST